MKPRWVLLYFLTALLLLSCSERAKAKQKSVEEGSPLLSASYGDIWNVVEAPPDLDLVEASKRLKAGSPSSSAPPYQRLPTSPPIGTREGFWVTDLEPVRRFRVEAVLRYETPNALWYVDASLPANDDALRSAAQEFEDRLYPVLVNTFAPSGGDGPTQITVLNTSFRGAAGYFSSRDMYPASVHQFSNERAMIYINARALPQAAVAT